MNVKNRALVLNGSQCLITQVEEPQIKSHMYRTKGKGGMPSTTGNPSGGGSDNK